MTNNAICSVVMCLIVAFAPIATAHTVTKNNDTLVKTRHVKRQNQFSNYCSIFYPNNAANNIIIKFVTKLNASFVAY